MDFLATELKDLPEVLRQSLLKQIESALREVVQRFRPYHELSEDQSIVMCAKIFAIFDFIRKYKKQVSSDEASE